MYKIVNTQSPDQHPWEDLKFYTYEAAQKHASYLNSREEEDVD